MFTCILPGKAAVPEMTYTVLGGTLNPTHSLTPRGLKVEALENETPQASNGMRNWRR